MEEYAQRGAGIAHFLGQLDQARTEGTVPEKCSRAYVLSANGAQDGWL
jgi:hypothetical protein